MEKTLESPLDCKEIQPVHSEGSLQSCPTPCNPIDGSPPGSPVLGILQARTLEWVAISFSNAWMPASWVLDTRSAGASDPGAHAGLGAVPLPWLKKHRVDSSREEAVELGPETRSQRSEQGTGTQRLLRGEGRPIAGCVDGRLYGPGVTLPGFEPASLLTSCVTLAPVQPPPCSSSSSDNNNQFSLLMGLS